MGMRGMVYVLRTFAMRFWIYFRGGDCWGWRDDSSF
jgi:hypothetical protein